MDVRYKPPNDFEPECKMLERNYVTCLAEKAVKDEGVPMNCNVERILWFNLDCPTRYNKFTSPEGIRSAFQAYKNGDYAEEDD
mmetsp:Transcript_35083/g.6313  ORF Transcript_35083/g.6313 Transcript_35083/m.6313 type:complete len:83 (-) Transcript_35083:25-273(-)|eukprot:CAMPEP_0168315918 /NCGR_PEP_ID=MMETSP0210-20121227/13264_1 /TAXON_ID=40633 /ORGANISM="Condylostoma magnum, Strain COL2" /LENGTH=82 /DNA_ID=CAMNT_0008292641 /DNA_START=404 /DNA_END=652 /DNA_ORIENTATION=-